MAVNKSGADFESEFRPIFMTFTTGRSAEPTPFLFTPARDRQSGEPQRGEWLKFAPRVAKIVCSTRFPFAPHLAFWLAHYAGTERLRDDSAQFGGGKVMGTEGKFRHIRKIQTGRPHRHSDVYLSFAASSCRRRHALRKSAPHRAGRRKSQRRIAA